MVKLNEAIEVVKHVVENTGFINKAKCLDEIGSAISKLGIDHTELVTNPANVVEELFNDERTADATQLFIHNMDGNVEDNLESIELDDALSLLIELNKEVA